jgi:hypothetical protein
MLISGETEKGETREEQLLIFFGFKGSVHKQFILADKQSILHTTVTHYGDRVKMSEEFALKFRRGNWLLNHDNAPSRTSFFTREHNCDPSPTLLFTVYPI